MTNGDCLAGSCANCKMCRVGPLALMKMIQNHHVVLFMNMIEYEILIYIIIQQYTTIYNNNIVFFIHVPTNHKINSVKLIVLLFVLSQPVFVIS